VVKTDMRTDPSSEACASAQPRLCMPQSCCSLFCAGLDDWLLAASRISMSTDPAVLARSRSSCTVSKSLLVDINLPPDVLRARLPDDDDDDDDDDDARMPDS